jgi:hypothetical protein
MLSAPGKGNIMHLFSIDLNRPFAVRLITQKLKSVLSYQFSGLHKEPSSPSLPLGEKDD